MYDAIVVGARCAGSPTAMLLARKGHRVLLLDRARFPSDTLSCHYVHQPGVARLARFGLLERVRATGVPPARRQTFDVGAFAITAAPPPADGIADGYGPRRTVLDLILVEAAVEAGAELREGFAVEGLVTEDGRVTGIRGRTPGGAPVTERARIVVGADGLHSLVARQVEAPAYDARPARTCAYYSYWNGAPVEGPELYSRPGRMIITAPTNGEQTMVICYWPRDEFHRVRADIEGSFREAVALAPALAERLAAGERTERFYGTADLPFFFRKPHGPGWALVGDAGYHKDPITAQGITDAFRDAELLADAIHEGLDGQRPLEEALAGYEEGRNEEVRPIYELTHQLAGLEPPPPEMQALFAALRSDPEQASRFFGTIVGTVPIADFFAPENLARIAGAQADGAPVA
jgi:2-polyprenyl-6-methoxyphenol hydroxylase-like FAD-dependent oxidoreductase